MVILLPDVVSRPVIFGGNGLQIVLVTSLVLLVRVVVLRIPGALIVGFPARHGGETIQNLADGHSDGVDRERLRPPHLVGWKHLFWTHPFGLGGLPISHVSVVDVFLEPNAILWPDPASHFRFDSNSLNPLQQRVW
jgi:hypothetical protein